MKTRILFVLFAAALTSLDAAEVTVYPYTLKATAGTPLVIREYVSGERKAIPKIWTFPSASYANRTAWEVPVSTNAVLEAWADIDGNGRYDVGEPYGTNAGRDYPEIELSDASPITPRIDLVADKSDRGLTRDAVLQRVLENSINRPFDEQWIANNTFKDATTVADGSFKGQRIRVVRWLVNGVPVYRAGTSARVVLDKMIETDVRSCLTEADILACNENAFDLDWSNLRSEVTSNFGTLAACGNVTDVSYLIVVGDGSVAWEDALATNTVAALQTVITRKYGEDSFRPTPVSPVTYMSFSGKTRFRWKIDYNDDEAYTAFRIKVSQAATLVYDSGLVRLPARHLDGTYLYEARIPSGSNDWKIACFNSKFSDENDTYYTNGIPFTVIGE